MRYLVVTIERPNGTTYQQLVAYTGKDCLKELKKQLGKGYWIVDWRWY